MKGDKATEAIATLGHNWWTEKDGARVYRDMAEKDPRRKAS
jgi:hypothetical protein